MNRNLISIIERGTSRNKEEGSEIHNTSISNKIPKTGMQHKGREGTKIDGLIPICSTRVEGQQNTSSQER